MQDQPSPMNNFNAPNAAGEFILAGAGPDPNFASNSAQNPYPGINYASNPELITNPNFNPDPNPAPTIQMTPGAGSVVDSSSAPQPFAPAAPGMAPVGQPQAVSSRANSPAPVNNSRKTVELVALIITSLLAITFIGLFIWKYIEWDSVKTDVDGQIDAAVAIAVSENTTKLENDFLEREKHPYKNFVGPADYGSLSFEYPKTWNIYIAKEATNGGDFEAYLNPGEVLPVSATSINALRVTIRTVSFENAIKPYDGLIKNGKLSVTTRDVGGTIANVYTGELPSKIQGIVAIFKIRDKSVLVQTDAMLFRDEYFRLLDTISFEE